MELINNNRPKYFTGAFFKKILRYILVSIIVGLIMQVFMSWAPASGVYDWEIILHSFLGFFGLGFLAPLDLPFRELLQMIINSSASALGAGFLPVVIIRLIYKYYDRQN